MKRMILIVLLVVCLPAVLRAQGRCSLATIAGTYFFEAQGSSTMLPSVSADVPFHWQGATAPIYMVGTVVLRPDGKGEGSYAIQVGALSTGMTLAPLPLTITEVNEACVGVWQYPVKFAGVEAMVKERFVATPDGALIRSVPMNTGIPTATWIATARRVARHYDTLICDQNTIDGTYLLDCRGAEKLQANQPVMFAGGSMMLIRVSQTGTFTGTWYAKSGPAYFEAPINGAMTITPNCSITGSVRSPALPGVTTMGRGFFFDNGREGYFMPLVTQAGGQEANVSSAFCHAYRLSQ